MGTGAHLDPQREIGNGVLGCEGTFRRAGPSPRTRRVFPHFNQDAATRAPSARAGMLVTRRRARSHPREPCPSRVHHGQLRARLSVRIKPDRGHRRRQQVNQRRAPRYIPHSPILAVNRTVGGVELHRHFPLAHCSGDRLSRRRLTVPRAHRNLQARIQPGVRNVNRVNRLGAQRQRRQKQSITQPSHASSIRPFAAPLQWRLPEISRSGAIYSEVP